MTNTVEADLSAQIDGIAQGVHERFGAKHRAREQALPLSRETIRHAANAIRAIHRHDEIAAWAQLDQARSKATAARDALADHPDILYAGFVHDAQKEYAEASLTIALVCGDPLPEPESLGVADAAYLNGLGEAVGELRRFLLDSLRSGDIATCERLLGVMDELYSLLVTIDYPDAITGGLRRTTDVARGILEKTRGDLTVAARQYELEQRMAEFQAALGTAGTPR
ncbi:MAG: haloacid dehalogenase [Dehalococcoidia bacterium]